MGFFLKLRHLYRDQEVIDLLDRDGEDGGLDDIFFPGSDEEFGFVEEEIGRQEKTLVM